MSTNKVSTQMDLSKISSYLGYMYMGVCVCVCACMYVYPASPSVSLFMEPVGRCNRSKYDSILS